MNKKLIVFLVCVSMVMSNPLSCIADVVECTQDDFTSENVIEKSEELEENIDEAIENSIANIDASIDEEDNVDEETEPENDDIQENIARDELVEDDIQNAYMVESEIEEEYIENIDATPSEIEEDVENEADEIDEESLIEEEPEENEVDFEPRLSIETPSECMEEIQMLGTTPTSVQNDSQVGLRVLMNYHYLDMEDGVDEVTYDLASIGAADSGYISLKKDASGKVNEVTIDSVVLSSFTPDPEDDDKGVLFIKSTEIGDYKINFKGTTNIIHEENPTTEEYGFMGFLFYLHGESTLHIEGIGSASIYTKGFYVHELHGEDYVEPTKVYYKNLYINTQTYDDVAFLTYSTQCFFDNVNMDVSSGAESTHCFMLGIANAEYDDDIYITRIKNCKLKITNKLTNNYHASGEWGYPSPSAFNCSYTDVVFENCDVSLFVPHVPVGESRGIFMLHGFLTIDGGKMHIKCGDDPIDNLKNLIILAGIQAVNVNIINNAKVDIDCNVDTSRRTGAENRCDTWGIIYSHNVLIENSTLNIDVDGPSAQGIYYFGTQSAIEHDPVGNVEIINTNLNIDLMGITDGYTCVGITGRRIYFNLDKGSGKTVHIKTQALDNNVNFAVCAYKFNDNCFISISDGAYADKTTGLVNMEHYSVPVYTFLENSEQMEEENVSSEITIRAKEDERHNSGGSGGSEGYAGVRLTAEQVVEKMLTNNYLKEKVLDKKDNSQSYESSQIAWSYDPSSYQWSGSLITQEGNVPLNGFISVHNPVNNKVSTYYLHNGKMKIGWISTMSGKWYYFDIGNQALGEEVYGRNCIDDKWYYFDENGALIE